MTMTSQFADITSSSNFLEAVSFLLSNLVIVSSFMSMSSLVLELWQFSFIRDCPDIWKLEISLSQFCPIFRDWSELEILNLARMLLMKRYWMLQNTMVTAFTVSELLTLIRLAFLKVLFSRERGEECQFIPPPPSPLHIPRRTYLISI